MRAPAKSATPRNSLTRREAVDPLTGSDLPSKLDLHNDGQHERPPPGTFAEETAQLDAQLLLDEPLVRALFDAGLIDDVAEQPRAVGEQRLAVLHDESARDDVGNAFERARLFVDRHDGHDEAFLRQMPPVAQDLVSDLSSPCVVNQHAPDGRFAGNPSAGLVEGDHVAVFREENRWT